MYLSATIGPVIYFNSATTTGD